MREFFCSLTASDNLKFRFATDGEGNYGYLRADDRGVSPTGVDNSRKYLKGFFDYLLENDFITTDLFRKIKPMKRDNVEKRFLKEAEIVRLRDNCKTIKERAIVDLLLSTGIRVSELINLNISDVDINDMSVRIYADKTKTWRTVYLDANAYHHLLQYLNTRKDSSDILFLGKSMKAEKRMSKDGVERLLQKIGKRANITQHITVHLFRKTFATRMYFRNMDIGKISKLLGHASIKTTEKYYLSIQIQDIKESFYRAVA